MDGQRIDAVARAVAARPSRRAVLAALLAGPAGWLHRGSRAGLAAAQAGCGAFEEVCSGYCVDVYSDPFNCGRCGQACPPGARCAFGACACDAFGEECGGICVDVYSDPFNCGGCGRVCPTGARCAFGACACGGLEEACGGTCVRVYSDPLNCGRCGHVCPPGAACRFGVCACAAFEEVCEGLCVDVYADTLNCGGCGRVCPPGAACSFGACREPEPFRTPATRAGGSTEDAPPWGVNAVRAACWTRERLEPALPQEFAGIPLDAPPDDQEGLYEFSLRRRSYFYREGIESGDRVIAVHVDALPDGTEAAEALATLRASIGTAAGTEYPYIEADDTSPGTEVPFIAYRTWGRGVGEIHALAWGGRQQDSVLTVYASVPADLAEFLPLVASNIVCADPAECDAAATPETPEATPGG